MREVEPTRSRKEGVVEAADDIPPQIRVAGEQSNSGARPITASSQAPAGPVTEFSGWGSIKATQELTDPFSRVT